MNILNILAQLIQRTQREHQIADEHRVPPDAIPAQVNNTNFIIDPATLGRLLNQTNTSPSSNILTIADRGQSSSTQPQTSQAPDQQQNTTTPSQSFIRTLCCCCRRTDSNQDNGSTHQTVSPLQRAP
ncbi:MAG: hypothetical protein CMF51_03915 [Legionellales bacterium]|nr:hypothetical protein [Legionellales bacterium]|tara:strand:- start:17 stop:397 length:381 start_codon:yes stop_codon:yes gene_type:complete